MTNDVKAMAPQPSKKKRKKIASLDRRKARAGWFFVLPFILGFLIVYLPMITNSIMLSFQKLSIADGGGYIRDFVGFYNYNYALFTNPDFVQTLLDGLKQLAFDLPAILIFSLFMAVLLNQKMAGRGFFRAVFFIPVVISYGIGAMDVPSMMTDDSIDTGTEESVTEGLVSTLDFQILFENMAVGKGIVEYVTSAVNSIYGIVNRSGVQMLIFLAALQSISPAIYESCKIDGATAWETFWKITLPMVSPMILVNGVYTLIDSFTSNDNIVMQFIDSVYGIPSGGQEAATAMSWIYFAIIMLLVAVIAGILSAFVFYQRKSE